ncbi:MAG TPA: hypothetical protein VEO75_05590 [Nitrososphaerales archaeon]|nr:hypothetical protein [Nitrososphaerales archaeon]
MGLRSRSLSQGSSLYLVALAAYALGVWLHIPYGGGHVYSDLVTVFQVRECSSGQCVILIPYVQTFFEYPVVDSMFMYAMGILANQLPGSLLSNYYAVTVGFLAIPTFLLIRELTIIIEIRERNRNSGDAGNQRRRLIWYFVLTPSFVFILLLNWYVIGVYFAVSGLRRYLEGRTLASGILFGLSAASNLVTAAPALGLLIASRTKRQGFTLTAAAFGTYGLINLPFVILNSTLWLAAFQFIYDWYIEGTWMLLLFPSDTHSPYRHMIPPVVFGGMAAVMLWFRFRKRSAPTEADPLSYAFVSMFAYVFSSYIYTPQLNLALLPFFVLLPVANSYAEFLTFDLLNSLIIILGFSEVLQPLGINYNFHPNDGTSVVWGIAIIRSLWVGKFVVVDGFLRIFAPGRAGANEAQGGRPSSIAPSPGGAVEADGDRRGAGRQRD